jgi:hypothetical protein
MTLNPASRDELAEALRTANRGGAKVTSVDLGRLNRIPEHVPEDMTVTVEAGVTLAELNALLAPRGQWLPIDPPHPDKLTIRELLDTNASGPRRYGCGTIRDHLIGLRVALADGRIIHSGGKVVKNVAGYDLMKLFVGAHGSLGVIVEATFKLMPWPEVEQFVGARCSSLDHAEGLVQTVLVSEVTPVVFDLYQLSPSDPQPSLHLVLGFAGTREDVAWQLEKARKFGVTEPATLEYEAVFHGKTGAPPRRRSVLPSRVVETLKSLGAIPFVARPREVMPDRA